MSAIEKTITEESEHSIFEENKVSEITDETIATTFPKLETEMKEESAIQEEAEGAVKKEESSFEKPLGIKKEPVLYSTVNPLPSLEVEVDFLLDTKRLPLTDIRSLVEGEVISLGCAEFEASLVLQEKTIAQAKLVLVDGHPSVQVTKVFNLKT